MTKYFQLNCYVLIHYCKYLVIACLPTHTLITLSSFVQMHAFFTCLSHILLMHYNWTFWRPTWRHCTASALTSQVEGCVQKLCLRKVCSFAYLHTATVCIPHVSSWNTSICTCYLSTHHHYTVLKERAK